MCPFTRIPFWVHIFDPQPIGGLGVKGRGNEGIFLLVRQVGNEGMNLGIPLKENRRDGEKGFPSFPAEHQQDLASAFLVVSL